MGCSTSLAKLRMVWPLLTMRQQGTTNILIRVPAKNSPDYFAFQCLVKIAVIFRCALYFILYLLPRLNPMIICCMIGKYCSSKMVAK